METTPTASVAAAPIKETVFCSAEVASMMISSGAVMIGATSSVTVIVCVAVAVFPAASVAVQVISVSPTG